MTTTENRILTLYSKTIKWPMGRRIFSYYVARAAPYFTTIKPLILDLQHNKIIVSMKNRRSVQNHLKTVHAIAMCNLCEYAGGICVEASIPPSRRWIPMGMTVSYLKKAKSDLTAHCDLSNTDWKNCDKVICHVSVKDTHGVIVMTADITMKVSDKPM